ncbi:MAG: sporulation protein YabP [Bacillota bacterium]|nr:sporulation protein YabP [Bacillota bacterium]
MADERTRIVDPRNQERMEHQVVLKQREELRIEGVENVESFDEQEVVVETIAGGLVVRGRELHINQFNLDAGSLAIHGYIESLEYLGETPGRKGKGIIGRLFR